MSEYYIDIKIARIVGSLFILCGIVAGFISYWSFLSDYSLHNDNWLCVSGIIEQFEFHGGGRSRGFWVDCVYSYEISGIQYRSNQVSIGMVSEDDHSALYRSIGCNRQKARGKTIPVWIKEEDPSVSVLINPQQRTYWGSVLPCFLALTMPFAGIFCWIISFGGQKS